MKRRAHYLILMCVIFLVSSIINFFIIQDVMAITYFSDDFGDGITDDWTAQSGSWNISGGEYHVSVVGISTVNFHNFTDNTIETKLKFTDAVGFRAGIIFRYTDNEHYYSFELSNQYDSLSIIKYTPQDPEYRVLVAGLGDGAYPIQRDIEYTLKVIVEGNFFRCFVNGQEVLNGNDNNYSFGLVGLGARSAEVAFDDFNVSGPISQPSPTPTPTTLTTSTPSFSNSPIPSPSDSPTQSPSQSASPTEEPIPSTTPSYTPTSTPKITVTASPTQNPTAHPTISPEQHQNTGFLGISLSPELFWIILAGEIVAAIIVGSVAIHYVRKNNK